MKHGGDLSEARARHGAGDPPWLDLSTGINPHSWPVPEHLRLAGWERLPGADEMARLRDAAREAYGVPDCAAIVAAPGTQAIIQWLARLAPAGAVAIGRPSYSGHESAWRGAGRAVQVPPHAEVLAEGEPRSRHDGRASFEASLREAPQDEDRWGRSANRVVVTPNNPDGHVTSLADLRAMAEDCAAKGGWLIVDEAFADLDSAQGAASLVPELPVVVLRSFGKFYGLAGLRLGFAIADPAVAETLREALGDWAVSGPAIAVGATAMADRDWAEIMRRRLGEEAAALDQVLLAAGFDPVGGTSLYRLVRHVDASAIHERLAAAHIWCRRFADWPDLLRFGLPPDAAGLARLAEALAHAQGTRTASPPTSAR